MKNTKKGFTLVELLVVIAILAILATVAVVGYTSFVKKANESAVAQELTQIKNAVLAEDVTNPNFEIKNGKITIDDLNDLNNATVNAFVTSLIAEMGGDKYYDYILNQETSLVYVNKERMVKATWNFATGKITTEKYDGSLITKTMGTDLVDISASNDGSKLTSPVTLGGSTGFTANVPAEALIKTGTSSLELKVQKLAENNNISFGDGNTAHNFDVHIEGIADGNEMPIVVHLGRILPAGLEIALYHTNTPMTQVSSLNELDSNNEYYYNAQTGEVSICVTNFSVFSAVETTTDKWDGTAVANGFASGSGTEANPYLIKTGAQLAYFRNAVDGGNTFEGKYVALGANIDLQGNLFDPIGFGYEHQGGKVFKGIFDGKNHTIYNLRQNCWELDPDKENYSTYTYSTAGGGLFASIKNATIKNLAMSGADIVFECVDMGIVVGYAQGKCHFENIVVTNSTIANYNRATGGVVGEVCYGPYGTDTSKGYSHTFKNITVDSSVVISSLWGSFDTLCGGVIGGKWGDATVLMQDVTVACELDVFSDVTSAYQWYAYRRCGMLIGYTEQESPKQATTAAANFLICENVKVYYGDWVNYTYCEFENTKNPGYKYPWVRVQEGLNTGAYSNPRYGNPTDYAGNKVTNDNHTHDTAAGEGHHVSIPFNQLYGGGQGVYGESEHAGVTVTNTLTKTIYFQNNWLWSDVRVYYWYEHTTSNGGTPTVDSWNNVAFPGVPMEKVGNDGTYDIYKIEVPIYAAGFVFNGIDKDSQERKQSINIDVNEAISGNVYMMLWHDNTNDVMSCKYVEGHKTIYFQNNWLWSQVTLNYMSNNIELSVLRNEGTYDIYAVKVPNFVQDFNISGKKNDDSGAIDKTPQITISSLVEEATYSMKYTTTNEFVQSIKIYFKPNSYWKADNAWFAARIWNDTGEAWIKMTDANGDGTYECYIPNGYPNVIFCRMKNTNTTAYNWENRLNQTPDLVIANLTNKTYVLPEIIYFKPDSNWKSANARFAAYFFGNGEKWVSMVDREGNGVYECEIPAGFTKVIFVRMNPDNQTNNWDNKWTQTVDIDMSSGKYLYTLNNNSSTDGNTKASGSWSNNNP